MSDAGRRFVLSHPCKRSPCLSVKTLTVVASKLLERTDKDERFSLLMLSKVLFVTAALDGQYESHLTCVDQKLGNAGCYIISYSDLLQLGVNNLQANFGNAVQAAIVAAAIYIVVNATLTACAGWLSRRFIRSGSSPMPRS